MMKFERKIDKDAVSNGNLCQCCNKPGQEPVKGVYVDNWSRGRGLIICDECWEVSMIPEKWLQVIRDQSNPKDVIDALINELKTDPSYYYGWQANIAMSFKDEWQRAVDNGGLPATIEQIHEIANDAAKNFLNLLIGKC